MAEPFDMGRRSHRAPGDQFMDAIAADQADPATAPAPHPLDTPEARAQHRQLLEWYYLERQKQASNRLEMAMDADSYDGDQWNAEDAEIVRSRGQVPLVFNEVAPVCDWLIGTERRTRVDWRVLPRTADDVKKADAKTKTLKYVADVNRTAFSRSRAFADAIKAGIGWVDDGARDDPTEDVLYSRYEDWRNVVWDSSAYDLDLQDARYVFRWRWVDEDIALAMFPERQSVIRRAMVDWAGNDREDIDDDWYLGEPITQGTLSIAQGAGVVTDARRRRVRIIEGQYRRPSPANVVTDGPLKGLIVSDSDRVLAEHVSNGGYSFLQRVVMRVHFAIFTETDLLALGPSTYRHNRFTLTPVWCYRRSKDRLPYGVPRRVRDLQMDLNKRASKALFLFSSNQVVAEKNAVDDVEAAREELARPDGWVEKNPGKELTIRRDTDQATGQVQLMALDAQKIQNSVGVNNENLGRQTNAVSGEAIKARQLQGSVGTTEPFDNLRFAVQVQGEKQLSLTEQFYTEEKVIRLTGAKAGDLEWMTINQPETQPDGSVRYLNDITDSKSDFVVEEADYSGTLRQVMFESLNALAQRLPPELAMRILVIAMEFSDLPNHDDVANAIRQAIGERDPSKELTPEEEQQQAEAQAMQAEALQIQRRTALAALAEAEAKVEKIRAETEALRAKAGGDLGTEGEAVVGQVRREALQEIERLTDELLKAQQQLRDRTAEINKKADTDVQVARIGVDGAARVAEIKQASENRLAILERQIGDLTAKIDGKPTSDA